MKTQHNKKKYHAIVFDHDGVLEFFSGTNPITLAANELDVPVDEFRNVYFKYNHLSNIENIPWDDMFAKVISTFNDSEKTKNRVMKIIKQNKREHEPNIELTSRLPNLRHQGMKLAVFSNNTSSLRARIANNGTEKYFDAIIISSEIGYQKPSKEAFEIVFSKLKVKPSEVIFIDDTPKSLENANDIGYTPILFENNEQLKSDLLGLNIEI